MKVKSGKFLSKENRNFILWFAFIFLLTFSGLYMLGLVPGEVDQSGRMSFLDSLRLRSLQSVSQTNAVEEFRGEAPLSIEIPEAGVNAKIYNSESKDVVILDEYLKQGVVRYPDSGLVGKGNMFLFGHSAGSIAVQNPAYKALNNIEKLQTNDEIYIKSESGTHVYKVRSVELVHANEALVDFAREDNMLTLSTCNTFGQKQERFVVEAYYAGKL